MPREELNLKHSAVVGRLIDSLFVFLFVVGVAWPLDCRPLPPWSKKGDFSSDDSEQGKGLVLVNLNDDKIWVFLDQKSQNTQRDTNANAPPLAPQSL